MWLGDGSGAGGNGVSGDFVARVSIADVDASGPFSTFDGVDRIIMLVDGPAMRLRLGSADFAAEPVALERHRPFAFDGGTPVQCEIDSPTRDLNVMTRRGATRATMRVQDHGDAELVGGRGLHVVVVGLDAGGGQACVVSFADGSKVQLDSLDCVVGSGPEPITVTGSAALIVIDEPTVRRD